MGCYTAPAAAALIHFFMRKSNKSLQTKHQLWLNQLFLGGAIFGVVDHAWNRELLAFSVNDMILGLFITLAIFVSWGVIVAVDVASTKKHAMKT
ncbi:hypothetical protein H6503_06870 [Candidatus Woesearchaeota archaeon]|nr:hypothetical protein [Candidatus Woesearchaeota archaeon]